jgi:hypothetical protein
MCDNFIYALNVFISHLMFIGRGEGQLKLMMNSNFFRIENLRGKLFSRENFD